MRSRRAVPAIALAALLGASTPAVADQRADPLRESVDGLVRAGFPGVVAYARDGARERRLSAGVADTATGEPATGWHRFRIARNTKAFTATVLLRLVGEGELSLVDTVAELLPGVLRGDGYRPELITPRRLLDHTSGYDPADTPEFFAPYLERGDRAHVIPPREVVRRAGAHGPAFAPGERTGYSNTNYLLAGMIIERITGRSVVTEIRERILRPLGLHRTTFPINDPRIAGPHLHGYDLAGTDLTVFSPSYDWTAGTMISTVDDLARFQRALLTGELLAPEQRRRLLGSVGDGYGLGLERVELPCGGETSVAAIGGTGGGPGYSSVALTTEDGRRQLVLAATVFDRAADLSHEPGRRPWPVAPMAPVLAALCG